MWRCRNQEKNMFPEGGGDHQCRVPLISSTDTENYCFGKLEVVGDLDKSFSF